ncbi:uncharacterized protein LOC133737436 [Rosa rugosa]|uniref:uncharacterized protein LOC133737436 n=1 Tax=Rosa rugosa TaxID=74645 RepID=UPI002B40119C|nr:uncharacterized protein LOC133737436 [Rosa rugosa]
MIIFYSSNKEEKMLRPRAAFISPSHSHSQSHSIPQPSPTVRLKSKSLLVRWFTLSTRRSLSLPSKLGQARELIHLQVRLRLSGSLPLFSRLSARLQLRLSGSLPHNRSSSPLRLFLSAFTLDPRRQQIQSPLQNPQRRRSWPIGHQGPDLGHFWPRKVSFLNINGFGLKSSKKPKSKTPAKKPKDSVLEQKSPAEFFAENKNIAGFGKCLYTTVRELVENSFDSTESISELPLIEITMV